MHACLFVVVRLGLPKESNAALYVSYEHYYSQLRSGRVFVCLIVNLITSVLDDGAAYRRASKDAAADAVAAARGSHTK